MKKILGLDLGTNSIGWAIVEMDVDRAFGTRKETFKPAYTGGTPNKGVVIFSEGVSIDPQKKSEKSRAAERTGYRGPRRTKFRRKLRKYETLMTLVQGVGNERFVPLSKEDLEKWRAFRNPERNKWESFKHYPQSAEFLFWLNTDNQGEKDNEKDKAMRKRGVKNPYYFRNLAVTERLDWENSESDRFALGRAFYHLAQRRGFASNKKGGDSDDVLGEFNDHIRTAIDSFDEQMTTEEIIAELTLVMGIQDSQDGEDDRDKKVLGVIRSVSKVFDQKKEPAVMLDEVKAVLDRKENLGKVKRGIRDLDDQLGGLTLGQHFYRLYSGDRHNVVNKIRSRYTDRETHYLQEFKQICEKQGLPKEFSDALKSAIFFQRPLKSQKGLVGKCRLQPSKSRCPISHPDFEEFRMRQFLANVKVKDPNNQEMRPLNESEVEKLLPKFYRAGSSFKFRDIVEQLKEHEHDTYRYHKKKDEGEDYVFNYKDKESVSTCPTTAQLMGLFGKKWLDRKNWKQSLYMAWINKRVKDGKDENGLQRYREKTIDEVVNDVWHCLFQADMLGDKKELTGKTRPDHLLAFSRKNLRFTDEQHQLFSKLRPLKQDYASLSLSTIQKILPALRGGEEYSHAVFIANLGKVVDESIWSDELERQSLVVGLKEFIEDYSREKKELNYVNQLVNAQKRFGFTYSARSVDLWREEVLNHLRNAAGKKSWESMNETESDELVNRVFDQFIEQMKLREGEGDYIEIERLDERVKQFLIGKNTDGRIFCSDQKRLKHLFHPSDLEAFIPVERNGKLMLGSPITGSIKNPMAMKTLHQLKKLINHLLVEGVIDSQTIIRIELARELNDSNKRLAYKRWQEDLRKQREGYREKIRELYEECGFQAEPTEDDVLKYQLWEEQKHVCLYSEEEKCHIRPCDFLGKNPTYDIEHTIPRSISLDNSQMNKTLCHKDINRNVKRGQLPSELNIHRKILDRIDHWKIEYEKLDDEIKRLIAQTKVAATKEEKDKKIQQRHYLSFRRDYLKGKYERFTMDEVKSGFKVSQSVDVGIITRYAQQYMRSVFERVESVNGLMVSEFRKAWGVQESYMDEYGQKHYREKDRSSHIHHCQDALVIACMSKFKYDLLAEAWKSDEDDHLGKRDRVREAEKILAQTMPWEKCDGLSFKEYVDRLADNTLIVHRWEDRVPKPIKKKVRVRGKIQYTEELELDKEGRPVPHKGERLEESELKGFVEGEHYFKELDAQGKAKYYKIVRDRSEEVVYKRRPKYAQGDSARRSLHKDSFYGVIQQPMKDGEGKVQFLKDGRMKLMRDEKTGVPKLYTVIRKELKKIKASEVEKIVDDVVREKVKAAIKDGILKITPNDKQENKIDGVVWMNEEKGVTIKKVRLHFAQNPITIKSQAINSRSKFPHKDKVYAVNEDNYALAIYESVSKGKTVRKYHLINMLDAASQFKSSNAKSVSAEDTQDGIPSNIKGVPFKCLIQKQWTVIFYKKGIEELSVLSRGELVKRTYSIRSLEGDRIVFQHCLEARPDKKMAEDYLQHQGVEPPKSLTKGETEVNFDIPWPKLRLSSGQWNFAIETIDFKIEPDGGVKFLRK